MSRKRIGILIAVSVAVAASLSFFISHPLGAANSRVHGGTPAQQALLVAELAKVDPGAVDNASLDRPPADFVTQGNVPDADGTWLYLSSTARSEEAAVNDAWQAQLVASAFARTNNLAGVSVRVVSDQGRLYADDSWSLTHQDASASNRRYVDAAAVRGLFARRAQDAGASVRKVQVLALPVESPLVTLETPNAADFVSDVGRRLAKLVGRDEEFDGRAIRVVDSSGRTVFLSTFTAALSAHQTYVDPQYLSQYGGSDILVER